MRTKCRLRMNMQVYERGSIRTGLFVSAILSLVLLSWGSASAQQLPSTSASPDVVILPDEVPSLKPVGANGAVENSNAPPQLRQTIEDQSDNQENPAFLSRHLIGSRVWLSGQSNFIFQAHTPFHSPYSGPNSFHAYGENALSRTLTLYTGLRLFRFTEVIASADEAGGSGLSDGSGVAAYVNADVISPGISRSVYVSRSFIHHTIALTADRIREESN